MPDVVEARLARFGVGKEWLLPLFEVESRVAARHARSHRPVFAVEPAEWIVVTDRMITRIFSRSALHEHADPAQRVQGVAALPADSGEIAQLLASDPAPEVRLAAAQRCSAYEALAGALAAETEPAVRAALTASLGTALAATPDDAGAAACLAAESCPDAVAHRRARARRRAANGVAPRSRMSATRPCWSTSR